MGRMCRDPMKTLRLKVYKDVGVLVFLSGSIHTSNCWRLADLSTLISAMCRLSISTINVDCEGMFCLLIPPNCKWNRSSYSPLVRRFEKIGCRCPSTQRCQRSHFAVSEHQSQLEAVAWHPDFKQRQFTCWQRYKRTAAFSSARMWMQQVVETFWPWKATAT